MNFSIQPIAKSQSAQSMENFTATSRPITVHAEHENNRVTSGAFMCLMAKLNSRSARWYCAPPKSLLLPLPTSISCENKIARKTIKQFFVDEQNELENRSISTFSRGVRRDRVTETTEKHAGQRSSLLFAHQRCGRKHHRIYKYNHHFLGLNVLQYVHSRRGSHRTPGRNQHQNT